MQYCTCVLYLDFGLFPQNTKWLLKLHYHVNQFHVKKALYSSLAQKDTLLFRGPRFRSGKTERLEAVNGHFGWLHFISGVCVYILLCCSNQYCISDA